MRSLRSRLRHKITVQVNTPTQDSYGEPIESWGTLVTRWSSVRPVSGKEYFNAKQTNSENSLTFLIRHDSTTETITTKHRISWDSRIFDIESIINIMEQDKNLLITASEQT